MRERLICAVIIGYGVGILNASQFVESPLAKLTMMATGILLTSGAWLFDYKFYRKRG